MTEEPTQFKAWYVKEHCKDLSAISIPEIMTKNSLGEYSSFHVNGAYSAWQHQQQRIDELEKKLKIAVDAMQNLVKVKGRHNTEIAYKRIEDGLKQIDATK